MTRLDNLVVALAPVMLARMENPKDWTPAELRKFAQGVVAFAWAIEQASADHELQLMTPPGDRRGP